MNKKISITFDNGDVFHVPQSIIAENRTEYYSKVDGFEKGSKEWFEEYEHSLKHEIFDWVQNNMNWEDISPYAVLQPRNVATYSYHENWHTAEIEFV